MFSKAVLNCWTSLSCDPGSKLATNLDMLMARQSSRMSPSGSPTLTNRNGELDTPLEETAPIPQETAQPQGPENWDGLDGSSRQWLLLGLELLLLAPQLAACSKHPRSTPLLIRNLHHDSIFTDWFSWSQASVSQTLPVTVCIWKGKER